MLIRIVSFSIFLFYNLAAFSKINTSEAITIGDIKQWIQIKGEKESDPVLLFLHGGPGNSAMNYADRFTTELQKNFIVVQWDQRETGKTEKLNPSNQKLTLALMEADVVEMIHYLQKRFAKEKILLMGHSWGGFLTLQMASKYPELFVSCFAISPMIHQLESERLSLAWMKDKATTTKNERALRELQQIKIPFEDGEQIYLHRNWLAYFTGNKQLAKLYVQLWAIRWLALFNEASAIDFNVEAPEIQCPIYFFIGGVDYQTHFELAKQYFEKLKAEEKKLFLFDSAGHSPHLKDPKRFQKIILDLKLPN
jgi:pimeloyl-ACP methyl ester carboxylesterase